MNPVRETAGVLRVAFASTVARTRHTLLTAAGFLIAALTLTLLMTIPDGVARVVGRTGLDDVAVVISSSATSAASSRISTGAAALVGTLPGVAHDSKGHPLVADGFTADTKLRQADGGMATILIRGVTPSFWRVIGSAATITSGRRFRPGINQLIVGSAATRRFAALQTGSYVRIRKSPWHVSGEFNAKGSIWGSELWTSMEALQAAYNAQGQISVVWVKLVSPEAFMTFNAAIQSDRRLQGVRAVQQRKYYAMRTDFVTHFARVAIISVATVLGLGALLAIFNALGMALTARRRDMAVLRAIGFRQGALAVGLMIEVLVVGAVCAAIAIVVAWSLVNGRNVDSAAAGQATSFSLRVTPQIAVSVLLYTLLLGFVGALLPIVRAVRAPLTGTLHDE